MIGTEGLKPQRSVIARIAEEFTVLLSVEQSGWNLVCEEKTRSGDFGFRSPKLAVRDVLMSSAENASERVRFTCARADGSLAVSAGDRTEELRLSPSLGWLLVYPFNGPAPSGYVWFSVVWLIALAFPAGYWIRCVVDDDTTGRSRSAARRARSVAIGAIAIAFGVGLVLAPLLAGTAPAAWWEWVSAVLGVAAGALAGSVSGRLAAVWESRLLIPRRSAAVAPASDTPR